jgi:hypothetical protein
MHILSIQIAKFHWKISSLRVFSVYVQILSTYYQYKKRFIPCILSIYTDLFRIFGECAQINLNIRKGIIFFTAFKGLLLKKKVCMCATGPKTYNE